MRSTQLTKAHQPWRNRLGLTAFCAALSRPRLRHTPAPKSRPRAARPPMTALHAGRQRSQPLGALLLAPSKAQPCQIEVLRPDIGMRQQIRFMLCRSQQLHGHSAAGHQAPNSPCRAATHDTILHRDSHRAPSQQRQNARPRRAAKPLAVVTLVAD